MIRKLAVPVVLALVLAACGDDGGNGAPFGAAPGADRDADPDDFDLDDFDLDDFDLDDLLGGDNGLFDEMLEGDDPLSQAMARQQESVVRITYRQQDGEEVTISHDGSASPPRTSVREGDTLLLSPGDGRTIQCEGLDGTSPTCTETFLPGELLSLYGPMAFGGFGLGMMGFVAPFVDAESGRETIAGRSATCSTYDFGALAGRFGETLEAGDLERMTVCIDDDNGWPLRFDAVDGDGNVELAMEATSVDSPTDADFEPPVEVETLDGAFEEFEDLFDDFDMDDFLPEGFPGS